MKEKHKIEFFSFKLNPKDEECTSFKKFAINELKAKDSDSDEIILKKIFNHFIKGLEDNISKNDRLKK